MDKEQVEELMERSKDDRAIIVGSEVRQLCALALAGLRESGEPHQQMDDGPWTARRNIETGRYWLDSADFTFDARVEFTGDFADDDTRRQYAEWLVGKLNAPASREGEGAEPARWTAGRQREACAQDLRNLAKHAEVRCQHD